MREVTERQLTSHVGLVVFLASWTIMFGALFFAYALLRLRAPAWPPAGLPALPLALPAVNTLLLLVSSATLHLGWRGVRSDRPARLLPWLLVTVALGSIFMVLQAVVWVGLWNSGVRPDTVPRAAPSWPPSRVPWASWASSGIS
jgi:cytochrome c oxidase subunit 3